MTMIKIGTTKEQSSRLIELGLNKRIADMYFPVGSSIPEVCCEGDSEQADEVCWSLPALIRLMPMTLTCDGEEFFFSLRRTVEKTWHRNNSVLDRQELYEFWYVNKFGQGFCEKSTDLVDAAFLMVVRLLENGQVRRLIRR